MGDCNWGVVWSVFNLVVGLTLCVANVVGILGGFSLCGLFNLLFGVSIVWLAITQRFCDQYAMQWFPFWNNFLFVGLTFIYFSCGVGMCINDFNFWCFLWFFMLLVGILYVIFWLLKTLANMAIPDPVPLETCC